MRWGALPGVAAPGPASCLALLASRAPAGARHPCEEPVSRLFPRSQGRPQVVPVSNGESILTAFANIAQEPEVNYFWFLQYPHGIHRKNAVIRT
jgi:hypothetical protein